MLRPRAQLEAAEASTPGLWVMGNYRTGVAFPDCVTFGYEHAKVVRQFLEADAESASSPPVAQGTAEPQALAS